MTAYFFAACLVASTEFDEGFQLNRCYHWDRAVCEAVFDECYPGWVATPIFRRVNDE